MNHLVSVIIPCYNASAFIDASIESVWKQDYPAIELIVVDDGSTDDSRERILAWHEAFEKKSYKLIYIYQDNQGPGGAVNTALKYVTGDYLTLLDADDVYLPGAIQKKAEFLNTNPSFAGVRNNGWRVTGKNRWLFITSEEEKQITDLFTALSFGQTNNWAGTYMVRTAILFDIYPDRNIDPSPFGQNLQLLLPVAYKRTFGYIDEPLMEYRIQPNSHVYAEDPLVQYKKSITNSKGWREIYRKLITTLIESPEERKYYQTAYDSSFFRTAMNRAIDSNQHQDACMNYYQLKQTGYLSLNDRIAYANYVCPPIAFGLRLLRLLIKISHLSQKK